MTQPNDAAKKAQKDEIKSLFKEALTEWQVEETTRRTEADKKAAEEKPKGFLGGLFEGSIFS